MGKGRLREGKRGLSRRRFLGSAAAATAFAVVPAHVLGGSGKTAPSEKLNIAGIGLGKRGPRDLAECAKHAHVGALCDVDEKHLTREGKKYPGAAQYTDYRRMLEEMAGSIDGVIVTTPHHSHAVISMAALKEGIPVYCETPIARSVWEARKLARAAEEAGVVTQMGDQGASSDGIRLVTEWIQAGAIGEVREVHCYLESWPIWPQGKLEKPEKPVPDGLDWDLWQAPVEARPYSPAYTLSGAYSDPHWRAWWDFGTGCLGDMAAHAMDPPFWALDLKAPVAVEAASTEVYEETAPEASVVRFEFPARNGRSPVTLYWYDGHMKPARPVEMEAGRSLRPNAVLFVGEDGCLECDAWSGDPILIPVSRMKDFEQPPHSFPRVRGTHQQNWLRAIKEEEAATCDFATVGGPLSEIAALGNVALRTGRRIEWDAENMKVTNVPEANRYVRPNYREGWSL